MWQVAVCHRSGCPSCDCRAIWSECDLYEKYKPMSDYRAKELWDWCAIRFSFSLLLSTCPELMGASTSCSPSRCQHVSISSEAGSAAGLTCQIVKVNLFVTHYELVLFSGGITHSSRAVGMVSVASDPSGYHWVMHGSLAVHALLPCI